MDIHQINEILLVIFTSIIAIIKTFEKIKNPRKNKPKLTKIEKLTIKHNKKVAKLNFQKLKAEKGKNTNFHQDNKINENYNPTYTFPSATKQGDD